MGAKSTGPRGEILGPGGDWSSFPRKTRKWQIPLGAEQLPAGEKCPTYTYVAAWDTLAIKITFSVGSPGIIRKLFRSIFTFQLAKKIGTFVIKSAKLQILLIYFGVRRNLFNAPRKKCRARKKGLRKRELIRLRSGTKLHFVVNQIPWCTATNTKWDTLSDYFWKVNIFGYLQGPTEGREDGVEESPKF